MKYILLKLIKGYQFFFSPWVGNQCRFHPTCSVYAQQALELHGTGKGSYLAIKRLLKCHPLHSGGIDLVPGTTEETGIREENKTKSD